MTLKSINASEAKARFYEMIDETATSHQPILIIDKRHNAVLVSKDDWRSVQETLHLLSIPGMRESIIEGLNTPISECSTEIDWVSVIQGVGLHAYRSLDFCSIIRA